jgi:hypothetical protein
MVRRGKENKYPAGRKENIAKISSRLVSGLTSAKRWIIKGKDQQWSQICFQVLA